MAPRLLRSVRSAGDRGADRGPGRDRPPGAEPHGGRLLQDDRSLGGQAGQGLRDLREATMLKMLISWPRRSRPASSWSGSTATWAFTCCCARSSSSTWRSPRSRRWAPCSRWSRGINRDPGVVRLLARGDGRRGLRLQPHPLAEPRIEGAAGGAHRHHLRDRLGRRHPGGGPGARGGGHIKELLAGTILWVTWPTVIKDLIIYAAVGLFHYVFRKRFILISEDPDRAYAEGMNVRLWDFLFYLSFGVIITLVGRDRGRADGLLLPGGAGHHRPRGERPLGDADRDRLGRGVPGERARAHRVLPGGLPERSGDRLLAGSLPAALRGVAGAPAA